MAITPQDIMGVKTKLATLGFTKAQAVIGFDGFVDEIIDVVDKRTSPTTYTKVKTIAEYGERISKAAGLSTNLEFVPRAVKLGGNGPIMANALSAMGIDITYVGALGKPNIHPVFSELVQRSRVVSIAEPAHTDALEFGDGKVMLGKLETLKNVNWESLTKAIPVPDLIHLLNTTDLIGTVNWTMLPYMTQLWQHLLDEVLAVSPPANRPVIFFDLADPEKRSVTEILTALKTIQRFNQYCRAILGVNRKEATEIAAALELELSGSAETVPLDEIVLAIASRLSIFGVVVHPTTQAACMVNGQFALVEGPYTRSPKLTTGAGDNFNAGFCFGQVLGFSAQESLILGVGTSGFYVRNGRSASQKELMEFLVLWSQHVGEDFAQ